MHTKLHATIVLGIISYCLCDSANTNTAKAPAQALSNITYTCDGNGIFTLNLSKVSSFSHFVITHSDTANGSMYNETSIDNCTRKLTDLTMLSDKTIQLTQCRDHVYLYAMNHSTSLRKIVGGASFHKYDLQCVLPTKGVIFRVGFHFENEKPSKVQIKTPELNLTMRFMNKNSTAEKSTFKIGEELKFDIQDNSAVTHKLKLKTCTSYSDTNHTQGSVKLYDSDGSVHEQEIFGKIDNTTKGDIKVNLHAFRYPTTTKVYMQCIVYVCNANDTHCGEMKRRRRSTDNRIQAVDGSFSAFESSESSKPKSSGQGAVVPWSMSVVSAATFITAHLLTKLG